MEPNKSMSSGARIALALVPLAILALSLLLFSRVNPISALTGGQPPVEQLDVERVVLDDTGIALHVVNAGPAPVTIAQVIVDDAYWQFTVDPGQNLSRLSRARVQIPYHWVEGEAHHIVLVSATGATFEHSIDVAVASPENTASRWMLLAAIGFLVGIVPVGIGLMWFPLLHRLKKDSLRFILALTVGLLIFLFFDTIAEALEFAARTPDVFQAVPLVFGLAMLSYAALVAVGSRQSVRDRTTPAGRYWIAMAIAIGIGVHNLGEGLAVGASIAAGEVALGSFLVVGFVLHNVTEGVGIGAPMAPDRAHPGRLILLTLIAGGPAIIGTLLGGFSFTALMGVIFFAIGAGAILQVIVEVGKLIVRPSTADGSGGAQRAFHWMDLAGVASGLIIMYATALLV